MYDVTKYTSANDATFASLSTNKVQTAHELSLKVIDEQVRECP
jgi:hypothetical protein